MIPSGLPAGSFRVIKYRRVADEVSTQFFEAASSSRSAAGGWLSDYYFFLSYARGDDRDSIEKFFRDLSAEVRTHAGLPLDTVVGFLDVHVDVGTRWSRALMQALRQCQTFIALVSPRYLRSEPCGREWTVFDNRLNQSGGQDVPALIPLLWLPPPQLPEVVSARQYRNHTMPDAYDRTGLRQIIRLQRHHDDYLDMLNDLARQIVSIATTRAVPTSSQEPDFDEIPSAFHAASAGDTTAGVAAHQVEFVVAAPTRRDLGLREMASIQRDPQYYGERAQEWAPYRPGLDSPVADFARAIAIETEFHAVITDLGDPVADADQTHADNQIVVLLVDLWSTELRAHRRALARFDEVSSDADEPVAAIMVPANHDDQQTQLHLERLLGSLKAIFVRRSAQGHDVTFRTNILSHQSFDADLRVVLERSRNRAFKTGTVYRKPPGPTRRRPILGGP
jgi:FxsC-like protein